MTAEVTSDNELEGEERTRATGTGATLAPAPDFRYVGLDAGPRSRFGVWASAAVGAATLTAGLWHGVTPRGVLLTALAGVTGMMALRRVGAPQLAKKWNGRPVPMGIVPWGILVDPDHHPRVLRWPAVKGVHVEMLHGRDQGTPTTVWSVVTVETEKGETLVGRASGAVSLDRLMAHLAPYSREQAHVVALDLDGERAGEGPLEPDVEPLLAAVRTWLDSAEASTRLDLPPSGYRSVGARAASERTVSALREVLRDRRERIVDPRAFAAACAAELHARELAEDLLPLVQSPHPVIAAVAKAAAKRLGAATARVGALDEVAPFLMEHDVEALRAWSDG
jgi:hypothetical protein